MLEEPKISRDPHRRFMSRYNHYGQCRDLSLFMASSLDPTFRLTRGSGKLSFQFNSSKFRGHSCFSLAILDASFPERTLGLNLRIKTNCQNADNFLKHHVRSQRAIMPRACPIVDNVYSIQMRVETLLLLLHFCSLCPFSVLWNQFRIM